MFDPGWNVIPLNGEKKPQRKKWARDNCPAFIEAFVSVFIVLANDGWSTIFFNHHRAAGSLISVLYFISLFIMGQLIMLNLFLAVLLNNFDEDSLNESEE